MSEEQEVMRRESCLRGRFRERGQRVRRIPPGKTVMPRLKHPSSRSNQMLGST